jgi:hypothetical protein
MRRVRVSQKTTEDRRTKIQDRTGTGEVRVRVRVKVRIRG